MKINSDFVTNSSASNYIFGKPGGKDMTAEILFLEMRTWCKTLLKMQDRCDNFLKQQHSSVYNDLLILRGLESEGRYANYDTCKNMSKALKSNREFWRYLSGIVSRSGLPVSVDDFYDFYKDDYGQISQVIDFSLFKSYAEFCDAPAFMMQIIDFRRANSRIEFDDIDEICCWYYADDYEDLELQGEAIQKYALEHLGQLAISSESGYIPYILECLLQEYAVKSCGHMG